MLAELNRFVGRDITLSDWPPAHNSDQILETAELKAFRPPEFFMHSDHRIELMARQQLDIHASFHTHRSNILLFGPNHLISSDGLWSCESRAFKQQFLDLVTDKGFRTTYPGACADIRKSGDSNIFHLTPTSASQVHALDENVFLATPVEPDNWGRWITTVVPKVVYYIEKSKNRKLLVRHALAWQKNWLKFLGVLDHQLVEHNPGDIYACKDLVTIENSVTNLTLSYRERVVLKRLAHRAVSQTNHSTPSHIFVSRLGRSKNNPHYRVLLNEPELIDTLAGVGFTSFEPEDYSLEQQIATFANAECIVCLGGAGLFNVAFCHERAKVLTIESSTYFLEGHSAFLSSLELKYGVLVGVQDVDDPEPIHKRWHIDVGLALHAVQALLHG